MSIVGVKELPRKAVFEVGRPRQLTREWVCVLSDDSLSSPPTETDFASAIPIELGAAHPTYANNRVRKVTLTEGYEGSPYHVLVTAEYGIILARELVTPVDRAALWEFESAPGEVPAFFYYDDTSGGAKRPLTNSAYDYFPGLVTEESTVVAKVTKNFASVPTSWVQSQNCVNGDSYLGCAANTWKVRKVTLTQTQEDFGGSPVAFWQATAELHYRESSHNLQLPDIGWNFIAGGQKRRCMVFDFENAEWVASPNPVALDGNGGQIVGGGWPVILNYRVSPQVSFSSTFGTAPSTPLPI